MIIDTPVKLYYALNCTRTHRAFTDRVGGLVLPFTTQATWWDNLLSDACFEACGDARRCGAVRQLFNALVTMSDDCLSGLAMEHLLNFATEAHLISLGAK